MSSSANDAKDGVWHTERAASNHTQNGTNLDAVVEADEDPPRCCEPKTRDFGHSEALGANPSPNPNSKLPELDELFDSKKTFDTTKSDTAESRPSTNTRKLAYTQYYNPLWTDSSASRLAPGFIPPTIDMSLLQQETSNHVRSTPNSPPVGDGQKSQSPRIRRSISHSKLATMVSGIALDLPHMPPPIMQQLSKSGRMKSHASHTSAGSSGFSQYSTML